MTPIDPNEAAKAGNSLIDHGEVLMRLGIISFLSGIVGGTWRFIRESHRRQVPFGWKLLFYYLSKISTACLAAYLALLAMPVFGLGASAETEQIVGILAAVMGSDAIGLLMRRIMGALPEEAWTGRERRGTPESESNE